MTDRLLLLEALARAVATPSGVPAAERACRGAADLLGARGALLTATPTGPERYAACATDPVAVRLGEIEELVGDGPGVRAYREDRPVVTLLAPGLVAGRPAGAATGGGMAVYAVLAGELAAGAGSVAVRSWPVRTRAGAVGALTVHGLPAPRGTAGERRAGPLRGAGPLHGAGPLPDARPPGDAEVLHDGQVLADALAPALLDGASHAHRARGHVRRAVGMVVAQTGLVPADAADLLGARAWAQEQSVVDLATAVLARCVSLADDDGPGTGSRADVGDDDDPYGTRPHDPGGAGGSTGGPGPAAPGSAARPTS